MDIQKVYDTIQSLNSEFCEITRNEDFSPFVITSNGDDYEVTFMGITMDEYYEGEIKTPFECFLRHQAFKIIEQLTKWSNHGRVEGEDGSDLDQAFVDSIIQKAHKYYGDGGNCLEISAHGHVHRFNLKQITKDAAKVQADVYLAELVRISVSHAMINEGM